MFQAETSNSLPYFLPVEGMPSIFTVLYCTKCFPPAIMLDPHSDTRTKILIPGSQKRQLRQRALGWHASGPTLVQTKTWMETFWPWCPHSYTKERKQGLSSDRDPAAFRFGTVAWNPFGLKKEKVFSVGVTTWHLFFSSPFCRECQPARRQVLLPTADGPAPSHIR